jgi:hypothetical protein
MEVDRDKTQKGGNCNMEIMKRVRLTLLLGFIVVPAATGQATRTWVSGVGDDANPCSRTAPCKTFAGAISKTAAGGEINVLDPGGFGGVTITKSVTISSEGFEAGVLVSGTNAIIVNAGANDVVVLRGLDIEGLGTGLNGIRFLAGAALHVEKCTINAFRSGTAGNGHGISFAPSGASELYVSDTIVRNNGTGSNGGGILIRPTGTGSAKVVLDNVQMHNNVFGLRPDGGGGSGAVTVTVRNSVASGNSFNGITAFSTGALVNVNVEHTSSVNNFTAGVKGDGAAVTIRLNGNTITGNGTGLEAVSLAQILSYGNNAIEGNGTNGAPTGIIGLD